MTRLSALTAASTVANTDIFHLVNDPSGTNTDKKITALNLFSPITLDRTNSRLGLNISSPSQSLHIFDGNIRMDNITGAGALTTALGAAGVLTGTYQYAVTFATATGETSVIVGNIASTSIAPSAQQVNLTNIPISADSTVTSRKIYRTPAGGDFASLKLLTTINDNTTTTFTDNVADGSLGANMNWKNSTGSLIFQNSGRVFLVDTRSVNIGIGAGSTSGGYESVAIGTNALSSLTTGIQNIGIGAQSGQVVSSGGGNILIGRTAGSGLTLGSSNTVIGNGSMANNVSGNFNTIVGAQAGVGTAANSYTGNTLIGTLAGTALTTGGNNILIGYQAGNTLTTGASNILIGYDIRTAAVSTANFMSIGNLIFSAAVDGTGTTLSSGNIGIGVVAPSTKLHVVKTDSGTNAVVDSATISHYTSGTPAAGYGTGIIIEGHTTGPTVRSFARIRSLLTTATDASRATRSVLSAFDSAAERDVIGWGANATAAILGFYPTVAAAPIAQPTTATTAATFVANTSAIANDTATFDGYTIGKVVKALRNLGLLA